MILRRRVSNTTHQKYIHGKEKDPPN